MKRFIKQLGGSAAGQLRGAQKSSLSWGRVRERVDFHKLGKSLAFSLVELMISLIVISIVTAAFAPLITKKLKTSDMSIGTATATSITSSAVCNSVSAGCIECENDKCLAVSDGYFINEITNKSQSCNSVLTGCATCSNATKCDACDAAHGYILSGSICTPCSTGCSACTDGYYLDNTDCKSCFSIRHCEKCSSSSVCTQCITGYEISTNKTCYKYECGSSICVLTTDTDSVLSLYRYNLGDGGGTMPSGINICYGNATCNFGASTPICIRGATARGFLTADPLRCSIGGSTPFSSYDACSRTLCNIFAGFVAESKYSPWHMPNKADIAKLEQIQFTKNSSTTDPFCYMGSISDFPICSNVYWCGTGEDKRCLPGVITSSEPSEIHSSFTYGVSLNQNGRVAGGNAMTKTNFRPIVLVK